MESRPGEVGGVDGVDGDAAERGRAGTVGTGAEERGRVVGVPGSLTDLLGIAVLIGIGKVRPLTHGDRVEGPADLCCSGTVVGGLGNDISSNAVKLSEPLVTLVEVNRPSLVLPLAASGGTSELLERPCGLLKFDCDALDDELSLALNRASTDSRSTFASLACALLSPVLMLSMTSAQGSWSGNGTAELRHIGVDGDEEPSCP